MFNPARWRAEKPAKIEALFEFHFQATQVPKLEWDAIVVSLVPENAARPTARTGNATAANGVYSWEKPIYERVKLTQDPKTGKINDRVYRLVVSAAISTKSRVLGEINVNMADYADAFKQSSVSFTLKGSNMGAILHVTLRRMHGGVEGRDADGKGDVAVVKQRKTLRSRLSNCDNEEVGNVSNGANDIDSTENGPLIINRRAKTKFPSSRSISFRADFNGNLRKCSSFGAISALSSGASPGQFTLEENGITNNNTYQNSASLLSPIGNIDIPRKAMTSSSDSITNTNWSIDSASIGSMESMDWSTNSTGETGSREMLQESDGGPDKLIGDVALKRQLQVLELELQTLRKQVGKENRRGQDLLKELSGLKEERDLLRRECEKHKDSQMRKNGDENVSNNFQFDGEDPRSMLEKLKEELNHEKNLSASLCLQLRKTQETNSELILAVRDLGELLEQKSCEACCVSCNTIPVKPNTNRDIKETEHKNRFSHLPYPKSKQEPFETSEQYALDILVKEADGVEVACGLDQKIIDRNVMVYLHDKDREDMEIQMEQLALDYEILQQENHYISSKLEQSQMREQLMMQYECSAHLAIINDLETHVENLERELQKHIEAFETDLETITTAKVEQEKRAIQSEEALRKTRLSNANTVEHLRGEFKTLYVKMSSTCYANGKLLMQALEESSELRLQKGQLEELLEKTNGELESVKRHCHVKFQQLLSLIEFKTEEANRLFLELKDKRKELEKQKASSEELILLRAEMEKLLAEKHHLSIQIEQNEKLVTEMEEMKRLIKESDYPLQEKNMERNLLQIELASFREEANKSVVELNFLKHIMNEQEIMVRNLNSDVTTLRVQHLNLNDCLLEDELEKQNLKQLVLNLTGDLQKKENTEIMDTDGYKKTRTRNKGNKSGIVPQSYMEVASLYDKIQLLEGEMKLEDALMEELRDSLL